MSRYYTVDEANALIPALEIRFTRILQLRSRMEKVQEQLQALGATGNIDPPEPSEDDELPEGLAEDLADDLPEIEAADLEEIDAEAEAIELPPDEVQVLRGRLRALVETLTEDVRAIESLGVAIKDLDTGLCDFLALREGREVWLCWKLGEKRITHWHDLSTGFAGRQPLDDEDVRRARPRVLH